MDDGCGLWRVGRYVGRLMEGVPRVMGKLFSMGFFVYLGGFFLRRCGKAVGSSNRAEEVAADTYLQDTKHRDQASREEQR